MDNEVAMIDNVLNMTNSSEPIKTGIGHRLKLAREGMGLSDKEAAARLYLNVKMITIIENESFSEGPPPTFMRGYLHSYARMLNIPESEINAALKELETNLPVNRNTPHVLHARPIDHTERYIRWITLFVVLILVVLVCIWWRSHSKYVIADVPPKTSTQVQHKNVAPPVPTVVSAPTPAPTPQLTQQPMEPAAPVPMSTPAATSPPLVSQPPVTQPSVPPNGPDASPTNSADMPQIPLARPMPLNPATAKSGVTETKKVIKHRSSKKLKKNLMVSLPEPG